jgi:hypothetical protein
MRRTLGFDVQLGAGTRLGPYDIVPALGAGASTRGGRLSEPNKILRSTGRETRDGEGALC